MDFKTTLQQSGLIAILRGLRPEQAQEIGERLYSAGFRLIEVPLNSPEPLESLRIMREALPDDCLLGAGTVMTTDQVDAVKEAGGQLIVMPHSDPQVIKRAKALGMVCTPGVATPTEAFAALKVGADALKLFPAEQISPAIVKAWRAVVPADIAMLPVGGITPENMQEYLNNGANGFGLGSSLWKAGMTPVQVYEHATRFMDAWHHRSQ